MKYLQHFIHLILVTSVFHKFFRRQKLFFSFLAKIRVSIMTNSFADNIMDPCFYIVVFRF